MPPPTDPFQLGDELAAAAGELAVAIRDEGPDDVARMIRSLVAEYGTVPLMVALAAMVPDDVPVSELLAWTEPFAPLLTCDPALDRSPPGARAAHGTASRRTAGCAGAACVEARRRYDAKRPPRRPRRDDAARDEGIARAS